MFRRIDLDKPPPTLKMNFLVKPKENGWPIGTVTSNGQFKVNFGWEPEKIESSSRTKFSFDMQKRLSKELFETYLSQPYIFHLNRITNYQENRLRHLQRPYM